MSQAKWPTLSTPQEQIVTAMRDAGREELINYAGAAHRDATAAWVCFHWLADRNALGPVLKSRALNSQGGHTTPDMFVAQFARG
jgi:hypothetical protein